MHKLTRNELIEAVTRIWEDESMSRDDQAALMQRIAATINAPYQYIVGAIHFSDEDQSAEDVVNVLLGMDGTIV